MILRKFLHSCILLEDGGTRILIDPGSFSFLDNRITPESIGKVDAIFITHNHSDHYFPEALRKLINLGCSQIYAPQEICRDLEAQGLPQRVVKSGEEIRINDFSVLAIEAKHGPLFLNLPVNYAYLFNGSFLHPGDSIELSLPQGIDLKTLALPTFAPWEKTIESLEFAKKIKPKMVVPIHDWFIKDPPLGNFYKSMYLPYLEKEGVEFKSVGINEPIEI